MLAEASPLTPLSFASLMLINAILFHILPAIRSAEACRRLFTAVVLFLPAGIAIWRRAALDGFLSLSTRVGAVAIGALLMAFQVVMLRLKSRPYVRQV